MDKNGFLASVGCALGLAALLCATPARCEDNADLRMAVARGDVAQVKSLIAQGVDVDERIERGGATALMRAAYGGDTAMVQVLLEAKADVNLQDDYGGTALIYAAQGNHAGIVRILLRAGADPSLESKNGMTALQIASQAGYGDVVLALTPGASPPAGSPSQTEHAVAAALPVYDVKASSASPEASTPSYLTQDASSGTLAALKNTSILGFSLVPYNFWYAAPQAKYEPDFLSYKFDTTALTSYQASLSIAGVHMGVTADFNNDVSNKVMNRTQQVAGFLGFNNLYVRYENAALRGTVTWTGDPLHYLPSTTAFNGKYTNIDFLWMPGTSASSSTAVSSGYVGLGYTAINLPVQFEDWAIATSPSLLQDLYDPDFKAQFANLVFGWDTMDSPLYVNPAINRSRNGFSPMFSMQGRFGYGWGVFSQQALNEDAYWANLNNFYRMLPATVGKLGEGSGTLGFQWSEMLGPLNLELGAGLYASAGYIDMGSTSNALAVAIGRSKIDTLYLNWGPILRAFLRW
jgi:hypothetical protein